MARITGQSKSGRLEQRLAQVERELKELKASIVREQPPWWRQIEGVFEGDEAFAEIVRLGAKIRKADRKDSR